MIMATLCNNLFKIARNMYSPGARGSVMISRLSLEANDAPQEWQMQDGDLMELALCARVQPEAFQVKACHYVCIK
jgi:hypothetical protein